MHIQHPSPLACPAQIHFLSNAGPARTLGVHRSRLPGRRGSELVPTGLGRNHTQYDQTAFGGLETSIRTLEFQQSQRLFQFPPESSTLHPPWFQLSPNDMCCNVIVNSEASINMQVVPREGANGVGVPRPMEWSAIPYNPQAPGTNGKQRTSNLESPIMLLTGHQSAICTMKFNPAGTVIASGSHDRDIFLWNVYGDCKNFMVLRGHKNAVLDLQWTTDGTQIISASPDKTLRAWDVETGKQIKKMAEHSSFVNSCCPSRRGPPLVVSGSDDGTAKLWDLRQRGAIQTFPDKYQITAVSFSDASDKIFTGGIDNDVKVWDLRRNEVTMTLQGHMDMITGMQLSPDGSYLLTNGMDCALRIWDMRPYAPQDRCVKILNGHLHNMEKNLLKCSWSPDGRKVTAGSADRMVYIWDTTTRNILYRLPGHTGSVNECVFHPHEPILGSCSSDKHIYLGEI